MAIDQPHAAASSSSGSSRRGNSGVGCWIAGAALPCVDESQLVCRQILE